MGDIFSLGFGPFRWVSCLEISNMLAISRDPDGMFGVAVDGRGINTHSNQQLSVVS